MLLLQLATVGSAVNLLNDLTVSMINWNILLVDDLYHVSELQCDTAIKMSKVLSPKAYDGKMEGWTLLKSSVPCLSGLSTFNKNVLFVS